MLDRMLSVQSRHDDPLTLRRSRSMAMLMLLLIGISFLLALVLLVAGTFPAPLVSGVACLLFLVVYLVNRSGQMTIATTVLLVGFCLLQFNGALATGAPLPAILFPCVVVVIAAAFGSPRAPLSWAVVVSALPFAMNLALYRSIVPPAGPIILPGGVSAPPMLVLEVIAVAIYWMLASISWLASRQLYQTIDEARAATQSAVSARQALAAQQADLAARNEQLTQVRQELEALVAALTVPVVPVADGIGLLPLVGALDANRATEVERTVLAVVTEQRMRALVIDLSGASGLRNGGVEALVRLCAALRLLGVTPVLAGLSAQGALLLSTTELALPQTVATVQDALSMLQL